MYIQIFLSRAWLGWWEGQGSARRNMAENLIKSEQLEFINGGWCMHDEAASYFIDMIDQTALGHRYINTQFGAKYLPKTTWQIDPFGHSGFQGSMMSSPLSGYNSVFYGRADYRDQQRREEQQTTEYFWQTSPSLGHYPSVITLMITLVITNLSLFRSLPTHP